MTNGELKELAFKAACDNRIWINAFTLIRPSDETLIAIGRVIVAKLQQRDALLPSYIPGDDDAEVYDVSKLTHMLYLSINAS